MQISLGASRRPWSRRPGESYELAVLGAIPRRPIFAPVAQLAEAPVSRTGCRRCKSDPEQTTDKRKVMFTDQEKRRFRKTKAAIKRGGQRTRRRELKEELARDPESVDQVDRYCFGRSHSSRDLNGAQPYRLPKGRPENPGRPE